MQKIFSLLRKNSFKGIFFFKNGPTPLRNQKTQEKNLFLRWGNIIHQQLGVETVPTTLCFDKYSLRYKKKKNLTLRKKFLKEKKNFFFEEKKFFFERKKNFFDQKNFKIKKNFFKQKFIFIWTPPTP